VPQPADELAAALAGAPLFAQLDATERGRVAARLRRVSLASGEAAAVQGQSDDGSLYVCVSGHASVIRDGVEVQRLGPGDGFGELALLTPGARAASVRALEPLLLGQLTRDAYDALQREEPVLGRKLLEAITRALGRRLVDITDGMQVLLRARSLPRQAHIEVVACGVARMVSAGAAVRTLLPAAIDGHPLVAALVDRTPVSLASPIGSSCSIEPLTTAHWEGQRIYRQSLGLLLLEAAHVAAPTLRVRLGPSVGFAQRVLVEGEGATAQALAAIEAEMRRLVSVAVPLREELWTVQEARELFQERGQRDAAELLTTFREPAVPLVSYGDVYALGLSALAADAGVLGELGVEADEGGLLLCYGVYTGARAPERASMLPPASAQTAAAQTRAMTSEGSRFLRALSVTSVGALNRACVEGHAQQLVRVHEGYHEKAISQIADRIASRRGEVKLVCVAGPSSSGKTTFIRRLIIQLQVNGINPVGLSLDDYYVDRTRTPIDEHGDYDYEALEALDLPLLGRQLADLLAGKQVAVARYDFRTGKSAHDGGATRQLGDENILLVEGLHGLNPRILGDLPRERAFRIFICPQTQLPLDHLTQTHVSDIRLLRRIVRDRHQRSTMAEHNILRWPKVRAGERKHIFPFQENADAVFDSSLAYELSVLRVYAERYLLEVPRESPAYTTAFRLLRLLDRFVAIYPDQVPPTSILREFIGGSGFEY
jgi:uridine kinase